MDADEMASIESPENRCTICDELFADHHAIVVKSDGSCYHRDEENCGKSTTQPED